MQKKTGNGEFTQLNPQHSLDWKQGDLIPESASLTTGLYCLLLDSACQGRYGLILLLRLKMHVYISFLRTQVTIGAGFTAAVLTAILFSGDI